MAKLGHTGENYVYLDEWAHDPGHGGLPEDGGRHDVADRWEWGTSTATARPTCSGETSPPARTTSTDGRLRSSLPRVPQGRWRQNWGGGVGNINGDGKSDILWRNSTTGENYLYPMNGDHDSGHGGLPADGGGPELAGEGHGGLRRRRQGRRALEERRRAGRTTSTRWTAPRSSPPRATCAPCRSSTGRSRTRPGKAVRTEATEMRPLRSRWMRRVTFWPLAPSAGPVSTVTSLSSSSPVPTARSGRGGRQLLGQMGDGTTGLDRRSPAQ